MSTYTLKLKSGSRQTISLELDSNRKIQCQLPGNRSYHENTDYIYADQQYTAKLFCDNLDDIQDMEFYVNGEMVRFHWDSTGRLQFERQQSHSSNISYGAEKIFADTFGYTQIMLILTLSDSTVLILYSRYIPILVSNSRTNASVQRMAEYVYNNCANLLLMDNLKSRIQKGLSDGAASDLSAKVSALKKVILAYTENLNFFKLNALASLSCEGHLETYEKLRVITPNTINFIAQHPEYLRRANFASGIRSNGVSYIPQKTLVESNTLCYDIYENQIVVGFLMHLYHEIGQLLSELRNRIDRYSSGQEAVHGYFVSAAFYFAAAKHLLTQLAGELAECQESIASLYNSYSHFIAVTPVQITAIPKPTHIFQSIRAYRQIYDAICTWFNSGLYDFSKEDFMVPLLTSSKLFEVYTLLQLINYFKSQNYALSEASYCSYPAKASVVMPDYSFLDVKNTFCFHSSVNSTKITLYYEPFIYGGRYENTNGTGLIRTTSLKIETTRSREWSYYCPDYVVKIETPQTTNYFILDAKFSTRENVESHYYHKLVFKYLFSVAPIASDAQIIGLCAINGKTSEAQDRIINVHNYMPAERCGTGPYSTAKILTLTENLENSAPVHTELFNNLFKPYI